jgi:hypothetical protein
MECNSQAANRKQRARARGWRIASAMLLQWHRIGRGRQLWTRCGPPPLDSAQLCLAGHSANAIALVGLPHHDDV